MTEHEIAKEMENATVAYKGFNSELKCRDMQYEVGKTYAKDSEKVSCCNSTGFHSCENPFDVLDHYSLIGNDGKINRFAEVLTAGKRGKDGEKQSTSLIKIEAELNLKGFIKAAFDFLWSKNNPASGDYSQLAASGDSCVVANIGINGAASATKGSWITLAEYNDNGIVKCVECRKVDGKNIKANVFYTLKNGLFTEVESDNT